MPRPSRKAEILAAAVACFAEYGYAATRIRVIADRAGVSEAALYRHFPSVEELAASVYLETFTTYASRVAAAIRSQSDHPGALAEMQLRAVVKSTFEFYREGPEAFLFSLEVLPVLLRRLPDGFEFPLEQIEAVVVAGQREGHIRAGQPNVLAAVFFGALLRPVQLTALAAAGAVEMRGGAHDTDIEEACIAALITR